METLKLDDKSFVDYYDKFIDKETSDEILNYLLNVINWKEVQMGVDRVLPRLQNWMADDNIKAQLFQKGGPLPWSDIILNLKDKLEELYPPYKFDYVLMNYYRNGEDFVVYHRDDEAECNNKNIIASLSFGAKRTFSVIPAKGRSKIKHEYKLSHGSLIVMRGDMQKNWKHSILKDTTDYPRINLTFRKS